MRTKLRRFERWSAEQAGTQGLTASRHQLMRAVRGDTVAGGPTVGDNADYLLIRHNTAVELINRSEKAGQIRCVSDTSDHRAVRLWHTPAALGKLEALSGAHIQELANLTPMLESMINDLAGR